MNCSFCGKQLSGGIDTFGAVGEPACRDCFWLPMHKGNCQCAASPLDSERTKLAAGVLYRTRNVSEAMKTAYADNPKRRPYRWKELGAILTVKESDG